MTNADRIRNMTDEQLVSLIKCPYRRDYHKGCYEKLCYDCCMEWLHREANVEEGTEP